MVRVKLNDGTEVLFEWSWDEMQKAFQYAVSRGHALEVAGTNGKVWAVNPSQISYFEVVDPSSFEDAPNGASAEAADRSPTPA